MTDNLRTWAERLAGGYLAGGYLAGDLAVAGYDPDLLAQARHYDEVSLAEDVARNNAHDTHHHLWDIGRIVRANNVP